MKQVKINIIQDFFTKHHKVIPMNDVFRVDATISILKDNKGDKRYLPNYEVILKLYWKYETIISNN